MLHSRALRISLIIIVIFATVGVANALAAANTVPVHPAGEGVGNQTGGTVSAIVYHLAVAAPNNVSQVNFDFTPTAGAQPSAIKIQLVAGGAWYDCTAGAPPAWSCDTTATAITLHDATYLRVVSGAVNIP